MYRFLAIILSILLLSLATVPCSDDIISYEFKLSDSTTTVQSNCSTTEHHDACSPFCVCNCCKTLTVSSLKKIDLPEIFVEPFFDGSYPALEEQLRSKMVIDIWQPPRLS